LYAAARYFEASIEYERQIFHAKTAQEINNSKYRKALCFKQMKEYAKSAEELQSIYFTDTNDSLFQSVCYEQSLCHYLSGEPTKALWKIDEYFRRSNDSATFEVFLPVRLFSLNDTQRWEEAKSCFVQYIKMQNLPPEKQLKLIERVDSIYTKKNRPKIRSAEKAENWSRFIPGAGQIYAGETGEGIINLLINSSILVFAGHQALNHYYITGYLAGLGLFNKTYHGGMKRAATLASQKNQALLSDFNSKIRSMIVQDIYQE
jgi:TM2 domain-containing membrane protein YozV